MIKLLGKDGENVEKALYKTTYVMITFGNGSAVSSFVTDKTAKKIIKSFESKSSDMLKINGYDMEFYDDQNYDVIKAEVLMFGSDMSCVKFLEIKDSPMVGEE